MTDQRLRLELEDASAGLSINDVVVQLGEVVQASNLCLHYGLTTPALCLLFVAIDTAASLDRRVQSRKPRDVFTRWAEQYLQPQGRLSCASLDLFSARCGLLHRCSSRTDLSVAGSAKEIWYTFREQEAVELRAAAAVQNRRDVVVLSLDVLTAAVGEGVTSFVSDLQRNPDLADWAVKHAGCTFRSWERVGDTFRPVASLEHLARIALSLQEKWTP